MAKGVEGCMAWMRWGLDLGQETLEEAAQDAFIHRCPTDKVSASRRRLLPNAALQRAPFLHYVVFE
jgi:hypothetical protein